MYEIIVTDEFIKTISNLPMDIVPKLTNSFVSFKKSEKSFTKKTFWEDFSKQLKEMEESKC